jgi:hypothetical protein
MNEPRYTTRTSVTTRTVQESTPAFPILGYTVIASLDSHLEIEHDQLRQLVTPLGFGSEEFSPPEAEPRTYIRRAIAAWLTEIATSATGIPVQLVEQDEETGRRAKPLVREIRNRDKNLLVLALVKENVDLDALGLSYLTNLRVFFLKPPKPEEGEAQQPGTLTLTLTPSGAADPTTYVPTSQELALLAGLEHHVDYYSRVYKSAELSRMIKKIIESMAATTMRVSGGVHFIPYEKRGQLIRLKELLEQQLPSTTGKNTSVLTHIAVIDDKDGGNREQVRESVHRALMQRVEAYEENIKRFLDAPQTRKRGIRKDLMEERIKKYEELKAELDLYHRLLGVQREEIEARIDSLEQEALRLITGYAIGVKREVTAGATAISDKDEDDDM